MSTPTIRFHTPRVHNRVILEDDGTAFVLLSRDQRTRVDVEDLSGILHTKWYASWEYNKYRVATNAIIDGRRSGLYLHALLMQTIGREDVEVDHVNGDTLDNRRTNLRVCTHAENQRNRGKAKHNRSGFKGVRWMPKDRNFRATITVNGQVIDLGGYQRAEDAARAYDEAVLRLHGVFGVTNFAKEDRHYGT